MFDRYGIRRWQLLLKRRSVLITRVIAVLIDLKETPPHSVSLLGKALGDLNVGPKLLFKADVHEHRAKDSINLFARQKRHFQKRTTGRVRSHRVCIEIALFY